MNIKSTAKFAVCKKLRAECAGVGCEQQTQELYKNAVPAFLIPVAPDTASNKRLDKTAEAPSRFYKSVQRNEVASNAIDLDAAACYWESKAIVLIMHLHEDRKPDCRSIRHSNNAIFPTGTTG